MILYQSLRGYFATIYNLHEGYFDILNILCDKTVFSKSLGGKVFLPSQLEEYFAINPNIFKL